MATTTDAMVLTFTSRLNTVWGIVLRNKNRAWSSYMGKPLLSPDPISWEESGQDNADECLRGATGNLRMIVDGYTMTRNHYELFFFTQELTDLRIEVYRDFVEREDRTISGALYFQGFVKTESATMPLDPYPYDVELPIVDCLAACEDIRPSDFMERCAATNYTFTFKQLLEWWIEDTGSDISMVQSQADIADGTMYINEFIDIHKNINNSPYDYIEARTYARIFEHLLGTTNMYLRGRKVIICFNTPTNTKTTDDTARYYRSITWHCWRWNGIALTRTDDDIKSTMDFNDLSIISNGADHSTLRIPAKKYYYKAEKEKQDVTLGIDTELNMTIPGINTPDGKIWGQGNLKTWDCDVNNDRKFIKIDTSNGRVSKETIKGRIELRELGSSEAFDPDYPVKVATFRSREPVTFHAIDALLLTGKITKRVREDGLWKDVIDYEHSASFSLKWGNLYARGLDWSTLESKRELVMKKTLDNDDTSQFYDFNTDPIPNGSYGSAYDYCLLHGVANYEGIHIPLPSLITAQGAEYLELTIYRTGRYGIHIDGLELKTVNENEYYSWHRGDEKTDEEIEYPGGGGLKVCPDVWKGYGHDAFTLHQFKNMQSYGGYFPINVDRYVIVNRYIRFPMAISFNPWNEEGSITL